jgi:hypothetical protein
MKQLLDAGTFKGIKGEPRGAAPAAGGPSVAEPDIAEPDYFELALTQFAPRPATRTFRIKTVAELDEHLRSVAEQEFLSVGLCCIAEEADWGSFWLLVSGERACIHLLEGPCLTGRAPSPGGRGAERVRFLDDGGNWHEFALADTVSREMGLRALRHWLPRAEKLPELEWNRTEPNAAADGGRDAGS